MLSRKHYQEVAEVLATAIRVCEEAGDEETVIFIANQIAAPLADWFEQDNPRFDAVRFTKACGVGV
jgi:hypothetical protein